MANKGKPEQVERGTQRLNSCLTMIALLAGAEGEGERAPEPALAPPEAGRKGKRGVPRAHGKTQLEKMLGHHVVNHPARLQAALKTAPESVKSALSRAIDVSDKGYKKALQALD